MRFLLASILLACLPLSAAAEDVDVSGRWLSQDKDAIVEIMDCGDGTPCGTLVWAETQGEGVKKDVRNPDQALQSRPLIGMRMIWGFTRRGDTWRRGKIYNAGNGKTYGSGLALNEDGSLALRGCVGPICRTQKWTRVPDHDERGLFASAAH